MKLLSECQTKEVEKLESRLIHFYNTCHNYDAFLSTSNHPIAWKEVLKQAKAIIARKGCCRILEIGAGRSGFGQFINEEKIQGIHLTSQDITSRNERYLQEHSNAVLIGSIDSIDGSWDIIFHTYVYEHMCYPRRFITHLWKLISPGGCMLIQSPRYDVPFYLPPSTDHLSKPLRALLRAKFLFLDIKSRFTDKPDFYLISDPSAFYHPFRRDCDAIHRVKKLDLQKAIGHEGIVRDYHIPPSRNWRDFINKKYMTLRVILKKRTAIYNDDHRKNQTCRR